MLRVHMHSVETFHSIDEALWVRDPDFDLVEDRKALKRENDIMGGVLELCEG
jgi:hypothetical protein